MMLPFQAESAMAIAAIREAALLTQAVQADINQGVIEKQDRSPVTVADFGSQALVCRMIKAAFPDDPIIAEEDAAILRDPDNLAHQNQVVQRVRAIYPDARAEEVLDWIDQGNTHQYSKRFWTLDPIDGTKGFLRREQYAIALALIIDGEVCVAALACPNLQNPDGSSRGSIYLATRGGGTHWMPLNNAEKLYPIHASTPPDSSNIVFCESVESAHSSHRDAAAMADYLGITAAPVRLDSQAKYAVVAHGMANVYVRLPSANSTSYVEKIWDHAAGALVVTEAGGQVTDITGKPLDFRCGSRLEHNQGIIATNGVLHQNVLAAVEAIGIAAL